MCCRRREKAPLMFHSPHIPPFPVMVMKKSFCKGKIRLPPDDSSLRSETEKPAEKERDRIHTGWSQVGNVFMGGAGKRASFRKDPKESPCLRGGSVERSPEWSQ